MSQCTPNPNLSIVWVESQGFDSAGEVWNLFGVPVKDRG